ncbi:hypothetical protein DFH07DRAFT_747142, partial [Mycena maculata]
CPHYARAAEEFGRLLKPGGVLVPFGTAKTGARQTEGADVWALMEVHEHDMPKYRAGLWRAVFETRACRAAFGAPQEYSTGVYALPATVDTGRAARASLPRLLWREPKSARE